MGGKDIGHRRNCEAVAVAEAVVARGTALPFSRASLDFVFGARVYQANILVASQKEKVRCCFVQTRRITLLSVVSEGVNLTIYMPPGACVWTNRQYRTLVPHKLANAYVYDTSVHQYRFWQHAV